MSTVDDGSGDRGLGGRVGGKVAGLVANASVAAKAKSAPFMRQVGNQVLHDFFEGTGAELRATMGPTFKALSEHGDTPDELRPLFAFLARGKGEMASFIGGNITGTVISGGLGDLITNVLAPPIHAIIGQEPNAELAVGDVARAKSRGINIGRDWADEARRAGYNRDRFNALVELNHERPDLAIILDLLNRKEISDTDARGALLQLGFKEADLDGILSTRHVLLDPARLADLVTFGVLTEDAATPMSERAGLSQDQFHLLVEGNGTPPSNVDLAFAYRRGVIDRDRFIRGLTQSSLRNEWIPYVEKMVLAPMSVSDAVESVVQNALTDAEGREIARQNGLIPEHWDPLVAIAGNPPGVQEMVSMWHRGQLTKDQLVQGIRESRLKNKYIQPTIDASETLPPERSIVSLVSKGALTPDVGMDLLLRRGYAPDVAQALLSEAHAEKTAKQRDLSESQVVALYTDRAMTRDQATGLLAALGYDDSEIGWILSLADLARLKRFQDAAISRAHSLYVAYKLDGTEVSTTLDALGIDPNQRNDLLALWDIERGVNTKQLTLAQLEAAFKHEVIDGQTLFDRLQGIGYARDDAGIIVSTLGVDVTTLT